MNLVTRNFKIEAKKYYEIHVEHDVDLFVLQLNKIKLRR